MTYEPYKLSSSPSLSIIYYIHFVAHNWWYQLPGLPVAERFLEVFHLFSRGQVALFCHAPWQCSSPGAGSPAFPGGPSWPILDVGKTPTKFRVEHRGTPWKLYQVLKSSLAPQFFKASTPSRAGCIDIFFSYSGLVGNRTVAFWRFPVFLKKHISGQYWRLTCTPLYPSEPCFVFRENNTCLKFSTMRGGSGRHKKRMVRVPSSKTLTGLRPQYKDVTKVRDSSWDAVGYMVSLKTLAKSNEIPGFIIISEIFSHEHGNFGISPMLVLPRDCDGRWSLCTMMRKAEHPETLKCPSSAWSGSISWDLGWAPEADLHDYALGKEGGHSLFFPACLSWWKVTIYWAWVVVTVLEHLLDLLMSKCQGSHSQKKVIVFVSTCKQVRFGS